MRFPIKIYKNSRKATLMSVLSNTLAALLIVIPMSYIIIQRCDINVLSFLVTVVSIAFGIILHVWSGTYTDTIAEKEICRNLGKQYLKHSS